MPTRVQDIFIANHIDGYALLELTEEDLRDMFAMTAD